MLCISEEHSMLPDHQYEWILSRCRSHGSSSKHGRRLEGCRRFHAYLSGCSTPCIRHVLQPIIRSNPSCAGCQSSGSSPKHARQLEEDRRSLHPCRNLTPCDMPCDHHQIEFCPDVRARLIFETSKAVGRRSTTSYILEGTLDTIRPTVGAAACCGRVRASFIC